MQLGRLHVNISVARLDHRWRVSLDGAAEQMCSFVTVDSAIGSA
jgi:hypothetical protein